MAHKLLGEIMIQAGWIDEEKLNKALKFQQQQGCLIGESLVKLHYASEEQVAMALGKQLSIPYASKENQILNPEKSQGLEKIIPEKFARENAVIPLFIENNVLHSLVLQDLLLYDPVLLPTHVLMKVGGF